MLTGKDGFSMLECDICGAFRTFETLELAEKCMDAFRWTERDDLSGVVRRKLTICPKCEKKGGTGDE